MESNLKNPQQYSTWVSDNSNLEGAWVKDIALAVPTALPTKVVV